MARPFAIKSALRKPQPTISLPSFIERLLPLRYVYFNGQGTAIRSQLHKPSFSTYNDTNYDEHAYQWPVELRSV